MVQPPRYECLCGKCEFFKRAGDLDLYLCSNAFGKCCVVRFGDASHESIHYSVGSLKRILSQARAGKMVPVSMYKLALLFQEELTE